MLLIWIGRIFKQNAYFAVYSQLFQRLPYGGPADVEVLTQDSFRRDRISRFELDGKYSDELLILTPAAVKTALQRQHISKQLIEYGFEKAREMGFRAALVEGNPANYRPRGFVTAMDHGIMPGKTVHLPHRDCLMVAELAEGALGTITGTVEYSMYKSLVGGAE